MGIIKSVSSSHSHQPPKVESDETHSSKSSSSKQTGIAGTAAGHAADGIERDTVHTEKAAAPKSAVDFNKMTQDQQYDYLQKLTVANANGKESAWKTGNMECNVVNVRGFKDGVAAANIPNEYNDTVFVCRMNNGKKEVRAFDASVDPGMPDAKGGTWNPNGNTHLADGFYEDAWYKGPVTGGEIGLRQGRWLNVNIDGNGDGQITGDERENLAAGSLTQLQYHRGSNGNIVGRSSAGCVVIQGEQYDEFQKMLDQSPQTGYSALMIDSSKLPSQNGPFERRVQLPYGDLADAGLPHEHGVFKHGDRRRKLQKGVNDFVPPISGEGGIGIIQTPVRLVTSDSADSVSLPSTKFTFKS